MTDRYNNPKPVAVGLIPIEGPSPGFLGIVRANEPGVGGTALPGGFVDEMESFEMAVAREVWQECRLRTSWHDWEPVCSRITANNRVMLFLRLKRIVRADEVVFDGLPTCFEVRALTRITASTKLVFSIHQEEVAKELATPRMQRGGDLVIPRRRDGAGTFLFDMDEVMVNHPLEMARRDLVRALEATLLAKLR